MMRKKELIENKISVLSERESPGGVFVLNYGFESQFTLASTITISYSGTSYITTEFGDLEAPYENVYKMAKGSTKSDTVTSSSITTSAPVTYSGSTINSIISITPSSDDKYIYTF